MSLPAAREAAPRLRTRIPQDGPRDRTEPHSASSPGFSADSSSPRRIASSMISAALRHGAVSTRAGTRSSRHACGQCEMVFRSSCCLPAIRKTSAKRLKNKRGPRDAPLLTRPLSCGAGASISTTPLDEQPEEMQRAMAPKADCDVRKMVTGRAGASPRMRLLSARNSHRGLLSGISRHPGWNRA
jgi:hypothetical protein